MLGKFWDKLIDHTNTRHKIIQKGNTNLLMTNDIQKKSSQLVLDRSINSAGIMAVEGVSWSCKSPKSSGVQTLRIWK